MHPDMTTKEIVRLIDWLKLTGHSSEQIENCIRYIAQDK